MVEIIPLSWKFANSKNAHSDFVDLCYREGNACLFRCFRGGKIGSSVRAMNQWIGRCSCRFRYWKIKHVYVTFKSVLLVYFWRKKRDFFHINNEKYLRKLCSECWIKLINNWHRLKSKHPCFFNLLLKTNW